MILGKLANPKVEMNIDEINHVSICGTPLSRSPKLAEVVKALAKRHKKSKLVILSSSDETVKAISSLSKYKVASSASEIKDLLEVIRGDIKNRILLGEKENPIIVVVDGLEELNKIDPTLNDSIHSLLKSPEQGLKLVLSDLLTSPFGEDAFSVVFKYQDLENFELKINNQTYNCK